MAIRAKDDSKRSLIEIKFQQAMTSASQCVQHHQQKRKKQKSMN